MPRASVKLPDNHYMCSSLILDVICTQYKSHINTFQISLFAKLFANIPCFFIKRDKSTP